MTAQHTPGPWRVDNSENDRVCVRAEDTGLIADCTDGFYNDAGDWVMAADSEPNARLIAAAPELLQAAQEYMRTCVADEDATLAFQAATNALRAAIAKATGTAA